MSNRDTHLTNHRKALSLWHQFVKSSRSRASQKWQPFVRSWQRNGMLWQLFVKGSGCQDFLIKDKGLCKSSRCIFANRVDQNYVYVSHFCAFYQSWGSTDDSALRSQQDCTIQLALSNQGMPKVFERLSNCHIDLDKNHCSIYCWNTENWSVWRINVLYDDSVSTSGHS